MLFCLFVFFHFYLQEEKEIDGHHGWHHQSCRKNWVRSRVFCLPENEAYLPTETSRNRIDWHAFFIKFFKKFKLLPAWQEKRKNYILEVDHKLDDVDEDLLALFEDAAEDITHGHGLQNIHG